VDELGIVLKKPVRNFGNESNYEYGINEGAPRVLRLLQKYQLKATFTAAAVALERAPQVAAGIVAGGHEVCAHGYRWAHQMGMSEEKEREFIRAAAASIEKTTGTRPVGWLSRYLHTADTRRILAEEGYRYHMDDFSRDEPFLDGTVKPAMVVLPYALDTNDMKMWNAPAFMPRDWLAYCKDSFDWLYAESASQPRMMSLGVHLRIVGRPGRIGAYEEFPARDRGALCRGRGRHRCRHVAQCARANSTSSAAPIWQSLRSAPRRATSCRPMGSAPAGTGNGSDSAGPPVALAIAVRSAVLCGWRSPWGNAAHATVGMTTAPNGLVATAHSATNAAMRCSAPATSSAPSLPP
jgi:peptidoglycan/xylan/chitin deacetylase (PgdA/CDA1 family)